MQSKSEQPVDVQTLSDNRLPGVAGAYWFFFDAAKNVNDDRETLQEECEGREGRGGRAAR